MCLEAVLAQGAPQQGSVDTGAVESTVMPGLGPSGPSLETHPC